MTWDRQLDFPSEGRRAEDFFALKNMMALAGFEPANLGIKVVTLCLLHCKLYELKDVNYNQLHDVSFASPQKQCKWQEC